MKTPSTSRICICKPRPPRKSNLISESYWTPRPVMTASCCGARCVRSNHCLAFPHPCPHSGAPQLHHYKYLSTKVCPASLLHSATRSPSRVTGLKSTHRVGELRRLECLFTLPFAPPFRLSDNWRAVSNWRVIMAPRLRPRGHGRRNAGSIAPVRVAFSFANQETQFPGAWGTTSPPPSLFKCMPVAHGREQKAYDDSPQPVQSGDVAPSNMRFCLYMRLCARSRVLLLRPRGNRTRAFDCQGRIDRLCCQQTCGKKRAPWLLLQC